MIALRPYAFSLRQLQYAVAVADEGSFSLAAERCAVSQPSLSAQVARLEDALGVTLFERSRPIQLTHAGGPLIAEARATLAQARRLEELASAASDPLGGRLRVGLIPTFAPYLLPRLHPVLAQELPALEVLWSEAKTPDLEHLIAEGEVDLGLIADPPSRSELEGRVLGRDPFLAALPDAHAASAGEPMGMEELSQTQVLLLDDGHCLRDHALSLCQVHALSPSPFHATSLPTLMQMVAAGLGGTLLPSCAADAESARADVHLRPITGAVGRDATLIWRRSFPREALVERFAALLGELFG